MNDLKPLEQIEARLETHWVTRNLIAQVAYLAIELEKKIKENTELYGTIGFMKVQHEYQCDQIAKLRNLVSPDTEHRQTEESTGSTNGPYIMTVVTETIREYNPNYGDDRECVCGHPYHRHFDWSEDHYPAGCKYCDCHTFIEAK